MQIINRKPESSKFNAAPNWALAMLCAVGMGWGSAAVGGSACPVTTPTMLGSGSSADPCQITDWNQLAAMGDSATTLGLHYRLENDLTPETVGYTDQVGGVNGTLVNGTGWKQIGGDFDFSIFGYTGFEGTFDGNGHVIDGLRINVSSTDRDFAALFSVIDGGAVISNLGVINVEIVGIAYWSGAIVGLVQGSGQVINSYATGTIVSTAQKVGGLVGELKESGQIKNSYSLVAVDGTGEVGGLVGRLINSSGTNPSMVRIENAYAAGEVKGPGSNEGGLVGRAIATGAFGASPIVRASFWNVDTTGQQEGIGSGTTEADSIASVGLSNAQMRRSVEFLASEWDLPGIWHIDESNEPGDNNGFPSLAWQNLTHSPKPLFAGGDGSESDPFQIADWDHLQNMKAALGSESHFILTNDLTSETPGYARQVKSVDGTLANGGEGWQPLVHRGSGTLHFTLNGNNKVISGLEAVATGKGPSGLFGRVRDSSGTVTIRDLNLHEAKIQGDRYLGVLIGQLFVANATLSNIAVSGEVAGTQTVGGLIGRLERSSGNGYILSGVSADVEVMSLSSTSEAGGLIGHARGFDSTDATLQLKITDSRATGDVTGVGDKVGGLLGRMTGGQISNSFASGNIQGSQQVGGLIGYVTSQHVRIENAFATGTVTATSANNSRVEAGGLIGDMELGVTVINSYAIGAVVIDATSDGAGGLFGGLSGGAASVAENVTSSFWNTDTSGHGRGIGVGDEDNSTGVIGKTTADMTSFATFDAAWNSPDIVIVDGWQAPNNPSWGICESVNEGYPFLLWQFKNNPCVSDPDPVLSIQVVPRPAALRVSWLAPLNDGGSPITRYVARANPSCEVPALANEIPGETLYSCDITGLDPEQTYQVFVTAFTDAGSSEAAALGNDNGGNNGTSTPASFAPNPIIVVPVNNPWALLVLVLMMLGLVVGQRRLKRQS